MGLFRKKKPDAERPKPRASSATSAIELMSFDELLATKMHIESLIGERGRLEIATLRDKLRSLTATFNISIAELFGIKAAKDGTPKERKKRQGKLHRDPETGAEWSGLGKRPPWLTAYIEAGRDPQEFQI